MKTLKPTAAMKNKSVSSTSYSIPLCVLYSFFILCCCFCSEQVAAQDINVHGTVKDANGLALNGISVSIKGTTTGTTTNAEGNFSIKVPDSKTILAFSSVGFITKEVTVGH